jgi:ankyrin repeat protein
VTILPIHYAAGNKSSEFCQLLIDAYPESVNIAALGHKLPIHYACLNGRLDAVQLLFDAYPEAIYMNLEDGRSPIDLARDCDVDDRYSSQFHLPMRRRYPRIKKERKQYEEMVLPSPPL